MGNTSEEHSEAYLRLAADFANYRRNAQKSQQHAVRRGAMEAVKTLLPAVTNLRRALDAVGATSDTPRHGVPPAFVEGLENTYRQFLDRLALLDVHPIEAVGQPFDPNRHEAVDRLPSDTCPDGTVLEEVETGYRAGHDTLIPSKVIVSYAQ